MALESEQLKTGKDQAGDVPPRPVNKVVRMVRGWIESERYHVGDELPSIRQISIQLGVTRYIVGVALEKLVGEGWVKKKGRRWQVSRGSGRDRGVSSSLLSNTIVTMMNEPDVHFVNNCDPGSLWYIMYTVFSSISESKCNLFRMDPQFMTADDLLKLMDDRPLGVVAFRESMLRMTSFNILNQLVQADIPTVVYGYEPELLMYDSVRSDQLEGTYQLVEHLAGRGCRRVLRFWCVRADQSQRPIWLEDRNAGYDRACDAFGLDRVRAVYCSDLPFHANKPERFEMKVNYAVGLLTRAFSEDPSIDAIMVTTDEMAFWLAAACRVLGREPGRDIFITGYDNYWQNSQECVFYEGQPMCATVDKRHREIGEAIVGLLLDRAAGRLEQPHVLRQVEPEVVVLNG